MQPQFSTYGLRDVVYNDSTVGISVVHGSKRFVSLLASGIPDLELDRRVLIERDGLSEESRSNGGFSERVELILMASLAGLQRPPRHCVQYTLTKRRTIELCNKILAFYFIFFFLFHSALASQKVASSPFQRQIRLSQNSHVSTHISTHLDRSTIKNAPKRTSLNCAKRVFRPGRPAGGARAAILKVC